MPDLINWRETPFGSLTGHAGTLEPWLFHVWLPERGKWVLTSTLPGQGTGAGVANASDPAELKARAEELLREFAASIGASFPDHKPQEG